MSDMTGREIRLRRRPVGPPYRILLRESGIASEPLGLHQNDSREPTRAGTGGRTRAAIENSCQRGR